MRLLALMMTAILILTSTPILAQQEQAPQGQEGAAQPDISQLAAKEPVMKSVFWNTLMGSAWGAVLGLSIALGFPDAGSFREVLIGGTTLGGMIGYGFGIYLVIRGVTFDAGVLPVPPTQPLGMNPKFMPPAWDQYGSDQYVLEAQQPYQVPELRFETIIYETRF